MNDASPTPTGAARSLLTIVLPAFNEQEVLPHTHERLAAMAPVFDSLGFDHEILFVNDGSRDATAELMNGLTTKDPHVRAVHLTRNFGHQASVTAGLTLSRGDIVVIMDCDLQDPPEVIPALVAKWREGYQVVYATRRARKEWWGKRLAYWTFYRLLARVAELEIPLDSGDFCLLDRSAVELLNQLPERQRFVRGLRTWVGLRQAGVEYERLARFAGTPAYTMAAMIKLAVDGLVSFSSAPLRMVTRLGLASAALGAVLTAWVVWSVVAGKGDPRGWASLACLVLFMGSVQLISLGIIGEYLSRVFLEVKGRPTFLVASIVQDGRATGPLSTAGFSTVGRPSGD